MSRKFPGPRAENANKDIYDGLYGCRIWSQIYQPAKCGLDIAETLKYVIRCARAAVGSPSFFFLL